MCYIFFFLTLLFNSIFLDDGRFFFRQRTFFNNNFFELNVLMGLTKQLGKKKRYSVILYQCYLLFLLLLEMLISKRKFEDYFLNVSSSFRFIKLCFFSFKYNFNRCIFLTWWNFHVPHLFAWRGCTFIFKRMLAVPYCFHFFTLA